MSRNKLSLIGTNLATNVACSESFTKSLLMMLMAVLLAACTTDDIDTSRLNRPLTMRLVGGLKAFDDSTATRAAAWTWRDGATVYLQFKDGNNTVSARAVYKQTTDDWTVSDRSGSISTTGQCEVYYFDGASSSEQTTVTLGSGVGVYADQNGSYAYADDVVTISATLAPISSRVRFVKPSGTTISTVIVEGIHCYTAYNAATNTFTTSDDAVTAIVTSSTGYTSYIYGTYTDATTRQFTLTNSTDGSDITFTRSFGTNVFQTGKSGTLTIPTKEDTKNWTVKDNSKVEIEAIDLGLPSGVKWANMNVGANRPDDYGDYFAWGETEPKSTYDWSTYKYCIAIPTTLTKYCTSSSYGTVDNRIVLDAADDAATANWGGKWRMPTSEEQQELLNKCTWTWMTKNGVDGYRITGTNGNSIFLPAGGYRYDASFNDIGTRGYYLSSSLEMSDNYNARILYLYRAYYSLAYNNRSNGHSVRPVQESDSSPIILTVSPESLTFEATGGSQDVSVTSNTSWSVSSNQTWCTVSKDSGTGDGTITVTVEQNQTFSARTATITVTADSGKTATVEVTQQPNSIEREDYGDDEKKI